MPDVPERAVEPAAEAMCELHYLDPEWARTLARAALEAAAPILAEAVAQRLREHATHPGPCDFCGRLGEGAASAVVAQRIDRRCGVEHAADLLDIPEVSREG